MHGQANIKDDIFVYFPYFFVPFLFLSFYLLKIFFENQIAIVILFLTLSTLGRIYFP